MRSRRRKLRRSVSREAIRSVCASICAKDLLRAEGFTDIRYVDMGPSWMHFGRGQVDFGLGFSAQLVQWADAGEAITVLAGVHPGASKCSGPTASMALLI